MPEVGGWLGYLHTVTTCIEITLEAGSQVLLQYTTYIDFLLLLVFYLLTEAVAFSDKTR